MKEYKRDSFSFIKPVFNDSFISLPGLLNKPSFCPLDNYGQSTSRITG